MANSDGILMQDSDSKENTHDDDVESDQHQSPRSPLPIIRSALVKRTSVYHLCCH